MKKKILVIGLCVVMAFSATACGKSGKSASDGQVGSLSDNTKADMQGTKYKSTVTLGQYTGLKVGESSANITDDEMNTALQKILDSEAESKKIEEGAVQDGDTVNIDYVGKLDGAEFEGGSGTAYDLTIGSGQFIDGFEDGLIGKNVGESVDLNLTFPENYTSSDGTASEMAGKAVVFTVKINYITRSISPELTDEFVKEKCSSYNGAKNVDDLKEYVKSQLLINKKLTAVWQGLLDSCEITYDDAEVQQYVDKMKQQYTDYYENYGMKLQDYLDYTNMTEDQFNEQIQASVKQSLKNVVIALAIARKEGLKVTEDEYKDEVNPDIEANTYDSLTAYQKDYPKQDTVDALLYYDVLEWVAGKCEIVPDSEIETTTAATTDTEQETTTAQ